MKALMVAASLVVTASGSFALPAQGPPPATYEAGIQRTWKGIHNKILAMAKDTVFPDDKLGWKPHPDARSVLEEFRHVTIGLEMTTAQLKEEKFDYMARVKADDAKPKTRASVVQEMEAAIAASFEQVEKTPKPLLLGWLEHQGEHYGKLVSNYRMNNIVPPISRPKPKSN